MPLGKNQYPNGEEVRHGDAIFYLAVNPKTNRPELLDRIVNFGCGTPNRWWCVHSGIVVDTEILSLQRIWELALESADEKRRKRLEKSPITYITNSAHNSKRFVQISAGARGVCVWGMNPNGLAYKDTESRRRRAYEVYRVQNDALIHAFYALNRPSVWYDLVTPTKFIGKIHERACQNAASFVGMTYGHFMYVQAGLAAATCSPRCMNLEKPIEEEIQKVCTEVFADSFLLAARQMGVSDWQDFFKVRITPGNDLPCWCRWILPYDKIIVPHYQHLPSPWLLRSTKLELIFREEKDWERIVLK